jgi:hypothetical protein
MKISFLGMLVFALIFHGLWGLRTGAEGGLPRPALIGTVLLVLAMCLALGIGLLAI